MLVVALLLLAAAAPHVESHTSPPADSSPPDWLLYGLAIAAAAAGFHFFRSLTLPPQAQKLHQQQQQQQRSAQQPSQQQPHSQTQPHPSMTADPNKAWTLAELRPFDGSDPSKPLLLGCGGKVFDVSSARGFYGPGAAYGVFAGKDASRGLARMEIEYTTADVSDLSGSQQVTLQEVSSSHRAQHSATLHPATTTGVGHRCCSDRVPLPLLCVWCVSVG